MHSNRSHLYLLSVVLWLSLWAMPTLHAQSPGPSANVEKELTALLDSFTNAYQSLPESEDPKSVLRYVAKDLTYSLFDFNILGRSRMRSGDYKVFQNYITYLARTGLTTLRYDVSDVRITQTAENIGTLVYNVNYETKEEDGIWVKGKETVTMALEKVKDSWKIVHYSIIQIEDEKLKGICLCELFASSSNEGELVARTTIPTGQQYQTNFDNFEFSTKDGETLIKVKDRPETFKRLASGMVIVQVDGEIIEIGVANNKRESVALIVRDYLYTERCSRLKIK